MIRLIIPILALIYALVFSFSLQAQTPVSTPSQQLQVYDCTGVKLDEVDPQSLTKAEQLALLDGALLDSVDRYSSCINQVQNNMAGGGGAAGGGGVSGGDQEGTNAQAESIAQAPAESEEQTEQNVGDASEQIESIEDEQSNPKQHNGRNKTKAGIVKPKDNDAIICQILYDAIAGEQDEVTRKGLQAQYNDYKCGR